MHWRQAIYQVGFDSQAHAIVTYHKYDANGISQIYDARYSETDHKWVSVQVSNWTSDHWAISGSGSLPKDIKAGAVQTAVG